jgi:hypothetical protein
MKVFGGVLETKINITKLRDLREGRSGIFIFS